MNISQNHLSHFVDGVFASTPLDRVEIPQDILDIRYKTRSNPLEWKGQFSPQFIEAIINHYKKSATRVLDPFAGSGTVLLESARAGLGAVGLEVNPAAANLASIYSLTGLDSSQREALVSKLMEATASANQLGPLFDRAAQGEDMADMLLAAWQSAGKQECVRGLLEVLTALVTLADLHKRPLKSEKVRTIRTRLIDLVMELPKQPPGGVEVRLADARSSGLGANTIDLVVTSPPYINVYNYHQKYRSSVEAMGWKVLRAARSEIGSNRKHRQNRVLTVVQYCLDMAQALAEVRRVLRPNGIAVFVVGRESMVRKTAFFNGEILAEIAVTALGFQLALKQERVFLNRFGQSIYEDILHLKPTTSALPPEVQEARARKIAHTVLTHALSRCPAESRKDILMAIDAVERVRPSAILDPAALIEE